jgi:transcriptional regulator with XRE-family HTH domain
MTIYSFIINLSIGNFLLPTVATRLVNFHYLMETFSEWLLEEMGRKNMSQQSLAQKSGITPAQISRVISGQRGLGEKSLTAIARALNISPITIFRKAGLLPEGGDKVKFEDWEYLLSKLTPDEQEEIKQFMELKIERRQKAEASTRAAKFKPHKEG